MPHSLSARKRMRQNVQQRERNRIIKSRIHTATRAFLEAVDAGDLDAAGRHLRVVERLLHRAANNGPIHRNRAAREISRLQRRLNAAAAPN